MKNFFLPRSLGRVLVLLSVLSMFSGMAYAAPPSTPLAANGRALLPIVVGEKASDEVKAHAATLAEYLGKISGAKFEIKSGDGQSGIALGTATDFPAVTVAKAYDTEDGTKREDYLLRSHDKGVYLIGTTPLAVQHVVWDLLYRLGYRQFFPGPNWEVLPSTPNLNISVDVQEHPDFLGRRIWYGFGSWKENMADKAGWDAKNRMAEGLNIKAGHAWESIIRSNKEEFEKHPEYLSSTKPPKLCVSNPGLRKLVVEWALATFEKYPDRDSISLDPSDGGWPDDNGACKDAEVYPTISDRVVTLANEVAEAVNKKYKNKYVGMYAYYMHSAPPTIKVHPNVAIVVATAYLSGGFSFDQLMEGWRKQGVQLLGVREYYSVFSTHWDRPGGAGSSDVRRIATKIPRQYELGGRTMSAESSESWGAGGLGHYVAARLLWDSKENPDAIIDDFFQKAFGPAEKPMREWYRLTDKSSKPLFTRDLVGRLYRELDAARKLTTDAAIRARLDDLALYTRYTEMLFEWDTVAKNNAEKKALGEKMLKFTYRWHRNGLMNSYVLWRHSFKLAGGRINIKRDGHPYPKETHFNSPRDKNPWMSDEPIPAAEIEGFIKNGIVNNPIFQFTPKTFSHNLVPATPLKLPTVQPGGFEYTRMEQNFWVWIENPQTPLRLEVTSGQIATRGKTTLSLYPYREEAEEVPPAEEDVPAAPDEDDNADEDMRQGVLAGAVAAVDVDNDRNMHVVELKADARGLHRLRIYDRGKGAAVVWLQGVPVAIESSPQVQTLLRGRNKTMYFYVPKGTKTIGGFAQSKPTLVDGDGNKVEQLPLEPDYFSVPVPPGQDGKLWRIDGASKVLLMTVPPYLFRSAEEVLLPREVVEADTRG